jgi:hypothetical protein
VSTGSLLFLALLAVEVPLMLAASRQASWMLRPARRAMFLIPLLVAFGFRVAEAFSTRHVLDWDETYYMSQAVSGAVGGGLYPYIYGFGPMPIMGGTGYAAYSDALAVIIGGPSIFSVRAVSLIVAAAGLVGLWHVARDWYGSAAAWISAAFAAASPIFALTNTARMDAWAFAYVSWAMVAVAVAWRKGMSWRWHFLAGLVCGFGVEVHIDTLVTTMACGVIYGWEYLRDAVRGRRMLIPAYPALAFLLGLTVALAVYILANVVPDPSSYYTMTVRIRVDATTMYSRGTSSLLGSFLDPSILMAKEVGRYRQLAAIMQPLGIAVLLAALACAAVRRTRTDRRLVAIVAGVLVFASLLLNNASPLYFTHVVPALLIPVGALFTHTVGRRGRVELTQAGTAALVAAAITICAMCASTAARTLRAMEARRDLAAAPPAGLVEVRARVPRNCRLVADGSLYVPYMTDYPRFISFRDTEVHVAMLYYYLHDEVDYWRLKDPDAVFAEGAVRDGLARYLADSRLRNVAPGLWLDPHGCR